MLAEKWSRLMHETLCCGPDNSRSLFLFPAPDPQQVRRPAGPSMLTAPRHAKIDATRRGLPPPIATPRVDVDAQQECTALPSSATTIGLGAPPAIAAPRPAAPSSEPEPEQ
jgi:hypothetical protein